MTIFAWTFGALALVSVALNIWQWRAAWRFPLHRRVGRVDFKPGVTLLKPLKGTDAHTEDCLRSWFKQDYAGPVQLLFAVASERDPAGALVKRLVAEFPGVPAQLLVCAELSGANAKVAKLAQLAPLAVHDVWMISDADVGVPEDYVANAVAPLADPGVGLVFSFYRLANPVTFAMRWEAVAINADFWSQVLQGRQARGLDFALGAVMTVRRAAMEGIGGFAALADCLADDYQLGHRIVRRGGRIEICPVVAACWDPPQGWRGVWAHQLRWARTIRVSMPAAYFFSILGNATFFALLAIAGAVVFAGGTSGRSAAEFALGVAASGLAFRAWSAQALHERLSPATARKRDFWMAWCKDVLHVAIWAGAFLGNRVVWRGVRYRVLRDGTLERIDSKRE